MRYFIQAFSLLVALGNTTYGSETTKAQHEKSNKLLSHYVDAYLELYQTSPECFFAYKNLERRGERRLEHLVASSLCSKEMKDYCDQNEKEVKEVIKDKIEVLNLKEHVNEGECFVSKNLTSTFLRVRKSLVRKKEAFLKSAVKYLSGGGLTQSEENISLTLKEKEEKQLYSKAAFSEKLSKKLLQGENKILLSDSLLRLARGNFYDVEDVDVIEALNIEKKKLKKIFLERIKEENPSMKRFSLNGIKNEADIQKKARLFGDFNLNSVQNIKLLKESFVEDTSIFELIMKGKTQRAMWHLRNLGYDFKANSLEHRLLTEFLVDERKTEIDGLNLGISASYVVHFESGHKVVYKPEDKALIACNPGKEVAAYIVDRMMNLNMVPLTFMAEYIKGKEGSSQYFVDHAYGARVMRQYNGLRPGKFNRPSGRVKQPAEMLLFDWLIGNMDRNVDNYMLLDTGKFVLIDHGMSFFGAFAPKFVSTKFVMKRLPCQEVYESMKEICENPEQAREALMPHLRSGKINVFLKKVELFVKKLEKLIERGEVTLKSRKDENPKLV